MQECSKDLILQEDLELIAHSKKIPWHFFENNTFFITGATGLIGSQLIKALVCRNRLYNSNIKILANIRNIEKANLIFSEILGRPELQFIIGDVTDGFTYSKNVDFIIHTANVTTSREFVTHPVEVIQTTLLGTQRILEFAKEKKTKSIVYLSSMEVFGVVPPSHTKATENDLGFINISNPRSCYPESKRMAECLCTAYAKEYNLPVKIARLSQTFGSGITYSENRIFAQFAKSVIENKNIVLHTKGLSWGNYCYTRDTIEGLFILLAKGNSGEAYTIANENSNIRIKDMAQMVVDKISKGKIKILFDIPESDLTYGYAPDTELHLSSAKMQALGWEPTVSLEESYTRMIKSMLSSKN